MTTDADEVERTRMSLGEHLEELRKRLVRGLLALAIAFVVGWSFYEPISAVILRPVHLALGWYNADLTARREAELAASPELPRTRFFVSADPADAGYHELRDAPDLRPIATSPMEGFTYALDVALYFALIVGSPVFLWQLWQFVAAGLYRSERLTVSRFVPYSVALFAAGVLFSYFWVAAYVIYYLAKAFPYEELRPEWRVAECFKLVSTLCLGMGLVFELPVAMVFVMRLGLIEPPTFRRYRRHFYFGAFVLSAVLSPPDFYSTFAMCGPMVVLYEIGILVGAFVARPRAVPAGSTAGPAT